MSNSAQVKATKDYLANVAEEARKNLLGEMFTRFGETTDVFTSLLTGANGIAQSARVASLDSLSSLLPPLPQNDFDLSNLRDLGKNSTIFTDNVIGNNAAILLTDNAQSTVNFLYINPIEFFNAGRPGDITLNIDLGSEATGHTTAASTEDSQPTEATENPEPADEASSGAEVSGNVVSNNAAILMTDNAQSDVDFLYVNPIEFFNEGRGSDITLNVSGGEQDAVQAQVETTPEPVVSNAGTATPDDAIDAAEPVSEETPVETTFLSDESGEEAAATEISDNVIGNNAAILLTDNAQSTVNFLYINPIEFFNGGRGSDITLNIDLGDQTATGGTQQTNGETANSFPIVESDAADVFDFEEIVSEQTTLEASEGEGRVIDDNVIGNNAAILLTDNAQSTVNFIYVNPIEFFNEGRSGDITLNISVGQGDDLVLV